MKEELLKLAERVEALSGPDREVDARIWCALNGKKYVSHWREYDGPNTRVEYIEPPKRTPFASSTVALQWTASLDAAMTLVPGGENGRWNAGKFNVDPNKCSAQVAIEDEIFIERGSLGRGIKVRASGTARTPALALCAAALRALAKEE